MKYNSKVFLLWAPNGLLWTFFSCFSEVALHEAQTKSVHA